MNKHPSCDDANVRMKNFGVTVNVLQADELVELSNQEKAFSAFYVYCIVTSNFATYIVLEYHLYAHVKCQISQHHPQCSTTNSLHGTIPNHVIRLLKYHFTSLAPSMFYYCISNSFLIHFISPFL